MMLPAVLCILGFFTGFLLIMRVPVCSPGQSYSEHNLSIIIPARNEESNLPRLLQSIAQSATHPVEVLVVDDASTDKTAMIARELGATVLASGGPPDGWLGKSWACFQGACRATGHDLLFLDADTYFVGDGISRLMAGRLAESNRASVLSVLPYHSMSAQYEQLSLFFNLLMAAGAGGFGAVSDPQLFGQSLLIARETYFSSGGHSAVRGNVVENLSLAQHLRTAGAHLVCAGGYGALHMRMFPSGINQMSESWTKSFVQGAAATNRLVLIASALWISALWAAVSLLIAPHNLGRMLPAIIYLSLSVQLAVFARKLGNYHLLTCFLYPLPLIYYCAIFGRAASLRALGRKTAWRGRAI